MTLSDSSGLSVGDDFGSDGWEFESLRARRVSAGQKGFWVVGACSLSRFENKIENIGVRLRPNSASKAAEILCS